MIVEQKKESFLWKVNKVYQVVADNIIDVEGVFHKHWENTAIEEIKKTGKVLL